MALNSKKTLLVNREDLNKTIEIQKYEFMIWILETIGISKEDLEKCFPIEGFDSFGVEQRILLRSICDKYIIDIVDDKSGGMKIYVNNESLIAEWKKPWTIMRQDASIINPTKRFFMEIHLDWWTIFDDGTK